nr:thiamine phosphate synthase [uncultured Cellulosilyticum sp.]
MENKLNIDQAAMCLYAVTDRSWLNGKALEEQVEAALKGGITCLQLREKDLDEEAFIEEAKKIKKLTDAYKVPFIINDNVNVALAVDADGVHVGQKDMAAQDVRTKLGPDKILGVSAQTVEQAISAQEAGADYIGVGAMFTTSTKKDANATSRETLKEIRKNVHIPIVAIGGINKENLMELAGYGADGIAVVSAIFAQENIEEATRVLKELSKEMVKVKESEKC